MSRAAVETVTSETIFGGIARRAPHLRAKNQVEDADNVLFSVSDGASRRPSTWTIRQLCTPPGFSTTDLRVHVIERDDDETYFVVYGQGTFRIFDMRTWQEAQVTIGPTALAYLQSGGATAGDLRLRSAVDATFVLNTKVIAKTKASPSYVLSSTARDYDVLSSLTPADNSYHRTLNASVEAIPTRLAGYYQYKVAGTTFATATFRENSGTTWASPNGNWNNAGTYGFQVRFRKRILTVTAGSWTQATKRLVQAGKFAGYEFANGDQINVTGGTGVTAGWRDIAAKISDNEIELAATTGFTGNNSNTTADAVGDNHEVLFTTDGADTAADMFEIAERLEDALQATAPDALVAWVALGFQRGYFVITAPYRGTHAAVYAPTAPSGGTNLTIAGSPFEASSVVLAAGTGTGSLTLAVDERWVHTQAPNQPGARLDEATMPMRLQRISTSPLSFGLFPAPWVGRYVGDDSTNPAPSLLRSSQTLSDVAFHADRLVFTGADRIAFGKTGSAKPVVDGDNSIYDFYKTDPSNIVETDPFQETIADDEIANIDFIVQFRKSLTLFTLAGRQYDLAAPDAVVAAGRVAITPSTRYVTQRVRPIALDEYLYFVASLGCESRLFEYTYDELTVASKADDVSDHAPGLLPQIIRTVRASANHEMVFLLEDRSDRVFVFRTHTLRGERRVQEAWSRWSFRHEVLDIAVSGNELFLLVDRAGVIVVERMSLEPESIDCAVPNSIACPVPPIPPPKPPPSIAAIVGSGGTIGDPPVIVGSQGGLTVTGGGQANDPSPPIGPAPPSPGGFGGAITTSQDSGVR